LAKLLAQKLGTVATASTIIRTQVGGFNIKDAKNLDEITTGNIGEYKV
jgi:tRNA U55 pseudouridine synthase TruB